MDLTQVLKRPIVTEQSMQQVGGGEYTFRVDKKATKDDIAQAVKRYFKVNVLEVRTASVRGKKRRVGRFRKETKLPDWKKAIVKLAPEEKIDVFDIATEKKK